MGGRMVWSINLVIPINRQRDLTECTSALAYFYSSYAVDFSPSLELWDCVPVCIILHTSVPESCPCFASWRSTRLLNISAGRQAGRLPASRGRGERAKRKKNHQWLKTLQSQQSHVIAGIRLIVLAPIGSGSVGEGGNRNKSKKQARPVHSNAVTRSLTHWSMSFFHGSARPTPFFLNCHPS